MLTTKNRSGAGLIAIWILAGALAGCMPRGPRALLDGKSLLDAGDLTNAVAHLQIATALLPTNAAAWNYYGLACHRAGQASNAVQAYQQALRLHPDLLEARFNLGCLWLEQNHPDQAKTAFTTYTLRRPNEVEGWLKLAFTQLLLRETSAAEKSYAEALRLSPKNPEAYNGLGLAALQRNRPRDAAQFFAAAAQAQPVHQPALLNLAITLHQYLRDKPRALQRYHEYLALTPRAGNWESVQATALGLEQELQRAATPPLTNAVAAQAPQTEPVLARVATNTPRAEAPAKPETASNGGKVSPIATTKPPLPVPTQTVQVKTPPEIKVAQDAPPPTVHTTAPAPAAPVQVQVSTNQVATTKVEPAKRSFLQRVNPVNLFRREPKPRATATPLPDGKKQTSTPSPIEIIPKPQPATSFPTRIETVPSISVPPPMPRYSYRVNTAPTAGNRNAAEQDFARGVEAQRLGKLSEAMSAYQVATQSDPAYFEAHYNLGLAASQAGRLTESLAAYETARVLAPDSRDAGYNFALALREAGYHLDAAAELERLLSKHPADTRARLALANLYAQQLRQPAKARQHYSKVLELEPRHPQADSIQRWLMQNPG